MSEGSTTTNNGWDIVTALVDASLSNAVKKLVPRGFRLTVGNVPYDVTCQPDAATGSVVDGKDHIAIGFPVEGVPMEGASSATPFSGDVTIQLDVSQVAFNRVTNRDFLELDGTASYLIAESKDSFSAATGFTMEAWVRTGAMGQTQSIMAYGDGSNPDSHLTITEEGKILLWFDQQSYASDNLDRSSLWDGHWHHIAVSVYDGVVSFYLDGVAKGKAACATSGSASGSLFTIGARFDGDKTFAGFFEGDITGVRVWATKRNQDQIQRCMNVNLAAATDEQRQGLQELWNFSSGETSPINLVNNTPGTLEGEAVVSRNVSVKPDTYVNCLSEDLQIEVTSDLAGIDEVAFNEALTKAIDEDLVPYAQLVNPHFQFQKGYQPSSGTFISLPTNSAATPYQLLALSMVRDRMPPDGDPRTLFADDPPILVPDEGDTNALLSYEDRLVLVDWETLLETALKLPEGALVLSDASGQWVLSLPDPVPFDRTPRLP